MRIDQLLSVDELLKNTFKGNKPVTSSDGELLPVFSQDGTQIGAAPRLLCHRLGLIHKVVYLFIRNHRGDILVQVRGDSGRIDVPVGGHVSIGDKSDKEALIREMFEELGIELSEDKITFLKTYYRVSDTNIKKPEEVNRELRVLYSTILNESDEQILTNKFGEREEKEAVVDIKWMTIVQIIEQCDRSLAADGLKASLPHYLSQQ